MNTENGSGKGACADLATALVLAADDELTTAEWGAVEHHLAQCAACRLQWAALARLDKRLREFGVEIDAQSPPDPAVRVRLVEALNSRECSRWPGWLVGHGKWGWAAASVASLCFAAMIVWIVLAPRNWGRRPSERPDTAGSAAAVMAQGTVEVVRVKLLLAPVGDPFLDVSVAESLVLADVAVGSDGQPRDIKLAE